MSNYIKESRIALTESLQKLLAPLGGYLWTVTTPDVVDKWELSKRWHSLLTNLVKESPMLMGVRVFERHPGGHGWHIHFVTPTRLSAKHMWVTCRGHRFGHIDVARITDTERICSYLCKYLGKTVGGAYGRMWACFGGFKGSRVSRCRVQTIERQYMAEVTQSDILAAGKAGLVHPGSYRDGFGRIRFKYQIALTKIHYGADWLLWWEETGSWWYF